MACPILYENIVFVSVNNLSYTSRKHAYIIFSPLKLHFYIVKLGFTGVYIIFLISAQKIDCGYTLEPPGRGVLTSTHNLCFEQEYEKISESENFPFSVVKFSVYMNRRVFVMTNIIVTESAQKLLRTYRSFHQAFNTTFKAIDGQYS